MTGQPKSRRRRTSRNNSRELIHLLNQRYHEQWERAEGLEIQLARTQGRWFGPLIALVQFLKRWLRPYRYTGRPGSKPGELADVPFERLSEAAPAVGQVSIIIPFRDRLELLRSCLRSLRKTNRRFETVLVDNGSERWATHRFLQRYHGRSGVSVLHCPGPFNFSTLCNRGARAASGEFLLFLNNDTEALTPDWLERMLCVAAHPAVVGAVGATLLYPDGTIQHAGLYPRSDGRWIHGYRGLKPSAKGDRDELGLVRTVPAVSGACLLIRRETFDAVGGFDERYPVAFGDVDLCRRVQLLGKKIAITPHAKLLHYEALSRGFAADPVPTGFVG